MLEQRYGHSAVQINKDQVLILGGTYFMYYGQEEEYSCTSEVLDIPTLVRFYGDEEKSLRTTGLKDIPETIIKQGPKVNAGNCIHGL